MLATRTRPVPRQSGITDLLAEEDPADAKRYLPAAWRCRECVAGGEGELFKVLAVGKGVSQPLLGFSSGNRSHAL